MSSDDLRKAAEVERRDWAGESNARTYPTASAFHLAIADWFESEVRAAESREQMQRQMESTRVRREPFPVYYDPTTERAIAAAQALLAGEKS